MIFDEVYLMIRRVVIGLRKLTGMTAPPDKLLHAMTKRIWKVARKHHDMRVTPDDWFQWWSTDAAVRNCLKLFTRRPEDARGLPTPDKLIWKDYAKEVAQADEDARIEAEKNAMMQKRRDADAYPDRRLPVES